MVNIIMPYIFIFQDKDDLFEWKAMRHYVSVLAVFSLKRKKAYQSGYRILELLLVSLSINN